MAISGGFLTGGSGGGGSVEVIGNGIVVNNGGQLSTKPILAIGPATVENPDAIGGPVIIRAEAPNFPLGKLEGANMGVTTDQVIPIKNTTLYRARRIVFVGATLAPAATMAGGIYTLPAKAGVVLVPATQTYQTLTDGKKVVEVTLTYADAMAMPYLYWSLTTANTAGGSIDIYVYGDVIKPLED